jgi:hypothetical protein
MSSRGGATPTTAPVGWVFLDRHRQDGITIRWRRGEAVAYVLDGKQIGDHGMSEVLDTIPVLPAGWTDLAEIRLLRRGGGSAQEIHEQRVDKTCIIVSASPSPVDSLPEKS